MVIIDTWVYYNASFGKTTSIVFFCRLLSVHHYTEPFRVINYWLDLYILIYWTVYYFETNCTVYFVTIWYYNFCYFETWIIHGTTNICDFCFRQIVILVFTYQQMKRMTTVEVETEKNWIRKKYQLNFMCSWVVRSFQVQQTTCKRDILWVNFDAKS